MSQFVFFVTCQSIRRRYQKQSEYWEREARKFEALWKLKGGK